MKRPWPKVKLGEVLRQREPDVAVDPTGTYQFAGVYCFGRGVFRGQERLGSQFSYPRLTRLRAGEFVYPKLMAWEGAFGVVPPTCEGYVVSPEFPVFEIRRDRLIPAFLGYYFQRPAVWETVSGGSTGTNVRRRRLNPADLLRQETPLPPLEEQRRLVAIIEATHALVQQARGTAEDLRRDIGQLAESAERLLWAAMERFPVTTLEQVTIFLARGRQAGQGDSDHRLIKTQHVQSGRYLPTTLRLAPEAAAKVDPRAVAIEGDTLIACSAAGCLGRVAQYSGDTVASTDTHVAIARADPSVVTPSYLYSYLLSPQGQRELRSRERGDWQREKVGFRLTELNLSDLKTVPIPTPPLAQQEMVVAEVAAVRAQFATMRTLRAEAEEAISALVPAVLNRAMRGEL